MISVIMPCYNEEGTIKQVLEALLAQDVPPETFELVLADGMSTDGTRDRIAAFQQSHPELDLRLVDNPQRSIPSGLNRAIEATNGDPIIRLDAHSIPYPDYLRRCVEVLEDTGASNVGGIWEIRPCLDHWVARSIAEAAAHPLGAGDARYRIGGKPGPVETVPFGAFRREWVERVGPFNEEMLTNEDYEYNTRIRAAGGLIWFDPSIRSVYFARSSLTDLARQYWRYGYWKARMLTAYPRSLRWRQSLPPLFVFSTLVLGTASIFWNVALLLLGLQWVVYLAVLLSAGVVSSIQKKAPALIIGLPIAILIMHLGWGAGFLMSLLSSKSRSGNEER